MPLNKHEFKKIINKNRLNIIQQMEKDLSHVLNFQEVIQETQKFLIRIQTQIE
jgi:hypothetical protein